MRDWVRVRVWVRLREAPREVEREGEAATDGDAEPVEVGDGEGVVDGGDPTLALLVGVRDPVGLGKRGGGVGGGEGGAQGCGAGKWELPQTA